MKRHRDKAIAVGRVSEERDGPDFWILAEQKAPALEDDSRFDLHETRDWEMWWCDTEDHPENN